MGRYRKIGLDYFPFDIDFFQDIKVRKLIKYQGGKAITVYALLLCYIYKQGYFMKWDKELPFLMSETTGFEEAYISEVIKCCMNVDLIDKDLYDSHRILTSRGIQERYQKINSMCKRKTEMLEFNLIDSEESDISSEEIKITSEEMPINSEKCTQRKEKERKGNKKDKEKEISPSPFLELNLNECMLQLQKNRQWLETLTMNVRSSGSPAFTMGDAQSYLISFFKKLANEGTTEKAPKDAMAHFSRWLTLELSHAKQQPSKEILQQKTADERAQDAEEREKRYKERESYAVSLDQLNRLKALISAGNKKAEDIYAGRVRMTSKKIDEFLNSTK